MLIRIAITVMVDQKKGILGKLEELRIAGYRFESIHSRGGGLFDLEISFDNHEAKPVSRISGIIVAPIKVRVDPKKGILGKLEELREGGYGFKVIHSRGSGVFDLEVSYDPEKAKPIFEVSGIVLASSDM